LTARLDPLPDVTPLSTPVQDAPLRPRVARLFLAFLLFFHPRLTMAGGLVLPRPIEIGTFSAGTYDGDGQRIGTSKLVFEEHDGRRVRVRVEISTNGGGRMEASAELESVPDGLRLLEETSQSFDAAGAAFPLLHVDHVSGVATCTPPPGSGERFRRIDLSADERIVNVPFNLLFLPLVLGRTEELDFQIFICDLGGRAIDFVARARPVHGDDGTGLVEVRFHPDFGMLSWLASVASPNLTFWFDKSRQGRYLAHRIPLYPGGPEVLVAREGVTPATLLER
jgi:hypothetical protein